MVEDAKAQSVAAQGTPGGTSPSEPTDDATLLVSSDQPFACPYCGQMLAASCRVCVACKQPVDSSQVRTSHAESKAPTPKSALPALEPARFPWLLFLAVLCLRLAVAAVAVRQWGFLKTEIIFAGIELLSAVWVFQDAQRRRVPKPLRWGLGSLFLWLLFFPWYLVRRRVPEAPCPSVEAEIGPVARVLLFALMVLFLLSMVLVMFTGSPAR
jgi:hypothetical protein